MPSMRLTVPSLCLTAALVVTGCEPGGPESPQNEPGSPATAFLGARIIDGSGDGPIENGVLVVREGRIEAVGADGAVSVPEDAAEIDLSGKTIIPGLINSHGHAGADAEAMLPLFARYGVTTVVSLGGEDARHVAMRDAQDTAALDRARIYVAGTVLDPQTPEEAYGQVEDLAEMNVDWAKIRVNPGGMPEEVYAAVIEGAHRSGLRLAAHMYDLADAKGLLRNGADFLAHSVRDREVDEEFVSMMLDSGVCLSPTLTREVSTFVYESTPAFFSDPFFLRFADMSVVDGLSDPANQQGSAQGKADLEMAQRNLATLSRAGVPIAFGTDSGATPQRFPGYFEHMELDLMVEAGMTPMAALVAATGGAAECMGLAADLGTLTPGRWADFSVLGENPLEDIGNTKTMESVWIAGRRMPDAG